MISNEHSTYDELGNWNFEHIDYERVDNSEFKYLNIIEDITTSNSLILDLGTGGGEFVINKFPSVKMIIATDFSEAMIETANKNLNKKPGKSVRFAVMDNHKILFPDNIFDMVTARHTTICARQIYSVLMNNGHLIIEGIDKDDCIDLKRMFGRGQSFNDTLCISQLDYESIRMAGFSDVTLYPIYQEEFYKTKEDLIKLLAKTPIIDNFDSGLSVKEKYDLYKSSDILDAYIEKHTLEKGILLKRVLYGIIARK